jgi:hypothetical protein
LTKTRNDLQLINLNESNFNSSQATEALWRKKLRDEELLPDCANDETIFDENDANSLPRRSVHASTPTRSAHFRDARTDDGGDYGGDFRDARTDTQRGDGPGGDFDPSGEIRNNRVQQLRDEAIKEERKKRQREISNKQVEDYKASELKFEN